MSIIDVKPKFSSQTDTVSSPDELAEEFQILAQTWRKDTAVYSSVTKKVRHQAYQKIIGMGTAAIPLILRELERQPGHLLWALHAISDEDPVGVEDNFDAAVLAWLDWGKKVRLINESP